MVQRSEGGGAVSDRRTDLLERLSGAFGPSGCEREVRRMIAREIGCADAFEVLPIGDLLVKVKGRSEGPKLMFDAHMDEVGFMVESIDDDGFIRFRTLGGIDARVMCGRRVTLGSLDGLKRVPGVISSKPIHLLGGSGKTTPASELYISIGAKNRASAEKYVSVGDYGCFDTDFYRFGDHKLHGKALDDRLGCAVQIEAIHRLTADRPPQDVWFVFNVREEIGLSGAMAAAWRLRPEYAVALEATACADISDVPDGSRIGEQSMGGLISLADGGTIYDDMMAGWAMELAQSRGIKAQYKRMCTGGNDAAGIQRTAAGVRVMALSAPSRYIHSESNVVDERDYFAMIDLVEAMAREISSLDAKVRGICR